jgi:hypothetical protein
MLSREWITSYCVYFNFGYSEFLILRRKWIKSVVLCVFHFGYPDFFQFSMGMDYVFRTVFISTLDIQNFVFLRWEWIKSFVLCLFQLWYPDFFSFYDGN